MVKMALLIWLGALTTGALAQSAAELAGTWSTKSNKTLTGPGFYDPSEEKFIEPDLTGISYSFTEDGYFESAYYRALANPTNPRCPRGMMQWQHGKFVVNADGSLELEPFAIDGRQLMSDPCNYETSILTRHNTTERFKGFEVLLDPYHEIQRLNLFRSDGAPVQPMYLALKPPRMLPTTTLDVSQARATAGGRGQETKTKSTKRKRDLLLERIMPGAGAAGAKMAALGDQSALLDADKWWWVGVFMTGIGSLLYFCY